MENKQIELEKLTAMQQFIQWIDSDCSPMDCIFKAKELLAIEKEQIKNSLEEGFMWSAEGWNGELISYYKDGNETLELYKEEYYNENYGTPR